MAILDEYYQVVQSSIFKLERSVTYICGMISYANSSILHSAPPLTRNLSPLNFSLVGKHSPIAYEVVEVSLPTCVDGPNGLNSYFSTPHGPHHLFDGDGMLHSIKISDGKVIFCSRIMKTYKYTKGARYWLFLVINYFSIFTNLLTTMARYTIAFGRTFGEYNVHRGTDNTNTSITHFGGILEYD
ncbi:hypothetical protein DH2020_002297 [Rehmannia glutinosa]|uniref:Uncharacterized protein n=1 Tax=Rehmannia glutinosa TaxID=99300 RepID=A0ABR0XT98_REHGL